MRVKGHSAGTNGLPRVYIDRFGGLDQTYEWRKGENGILRITVRGRVMVRTPPCVENRTEYQ